MIKAPRFSCPEPRSKPRKPDNFLEFAIFFFVATFAISFYYLADGMQVCVFGGC